MNLLPKHNGHNAFEYNMQEEVAMVLSQQEFLQGSWPAERILPKVYREVTIPGIGRRSDVIVQVTPRKIFNIECKIADTEGVLLQATKIKTLS